MPARSAGVAGRWGTRLAALAAAFLGACATTKPPSDAPPGMQALIVRTEPPGAACSVAQRGVTVAAVASTPETVLVSRDLCRGLLAFCSADELPALEVVCEKEGYLTARRRLPAAPTNEVAAEDPTVQRTPDATSIGLSFATDAAVRAAIYFPPVGIPIAVGVLAGSAAFADATPNLNYAYTPLAEILLVPEAFETPAVRDTFFADYQKKLEAAGDARVARVDERCRYWPCAPSESACVNAVCERQRARVIAESAAERERIPALRAQTRIVAP